MVPGVPLLTCLLIIHSNCTTVLLISILCLVLSIVNPNFPLGICPASVPLYLFIYMCTGVVQTGTLDPLLYTPADGLLLLWLYCCSAAYGIGVVVVTLIVQLV